MYTRALDTPTLSDVFRIRFRSNRAILLNRELDAALEDSTLTLEKSMRLDVLADLQPQLKLQIAKALFGLDRFEEAGNTLGSIGQVPLLQSAIDDLQSRLDAAKRKISLVEIVEIPGKGRGLVTTQPVQKGEIVLEETPFIQNAYRGGGWTSVLQERNAREVRADFHMINEAVVRCMHNSASLRKMNHLTDGNGESGPGAPLDVNRIQRVLFYNAFKYERNDETISTLFYLVSFMNHSCSPNVGVAEEGADRSRV
jgi:hypothetical protein